ncbi:MAG: hypothetical protein ABI878_13885 [Acidobacteriota bacterium]
MKDKRPRPDPERNVKVLAFLKWMAAIEKIADSPAYRTVWVNKKK